MSLILPKCRIQFTSEDLDFIMKVLGIDSEEAMLGLMTDEESMDGILDDERLFRAILELPGNLNISSRLYFYALVRHVLRENGIDDHGVADYVAELLAVFSRMDRVRRTRASDKRPMDYVTDMLTEMQQADDSTRFGIQVHVGNYLLFWSGVFPWHLRHRNRFKGAPKIEFFEEVGSINYRVASSHQLAQKYDVVSIFQTLSESFQTARIALNDLADRLVFLDNPLSSYDSLFTDGDTEGIVGP